MEGIIRAWGRILAGHQPNLSIEITRECPLTCPGWGGGDDAIIGGCLDAMWSEGPPPSAPCEGDCFQAHGHYMNMTSTGYTKVACGFHTDASGKTWSNQNFR